MKGVDVYMSFEWNLPTQSQPRPPLDLSLDQFQFVAYIHFYSCTVSKVAVSVKCTLPGLDEAQTREDMLIDRDAVSHVLHSLTFCGRVFITADHCLTSFSSDINIPQTETPVMRTSLPARNSPPPSPAARQQASVASTSNLLADPAVSLSPPSPSKHSPPPPEAAHSPGNNPMSSQSHNTSNTGLIPPNTIFPAPAQSLNPTNIASITSLAAAATASHPLPTPQQTGAVLPTSALTQSAAPHLPARSSHPHGRDHSDEDDTIDPKKSKR